MTTFGSLSLGSRLKRLSDRLIQDVVEIYQSQQIELNPTFFPLFNLLAQQGAQTVTQAAELLGVSHPAISKIARAMLKEGWISKTPDPQDERRQLLTLTAKSEHLLQAIQPVWHEIRQYLDQLMAEQQHPLLTALNEFEQRLQQHGFVQPVINRLEQQVRIDEIDIIGWQPALRDEFKRLNMAWLDHYFNGELTTLDRQALDHPESYYLARGGYIWFARHQGSIVGCIALAKHSDTRFEISKMGVEPNLQGNGAGRLLLLTALNKARELHAHDIYLESSSKLERALQLYRNMGFQEIPHPDGQSVYPRADIYMHIPLLPEVAI